MSDESLKALFDIQAGERLLVTGQSGSGKTVLMAYLARHHLPRPILILDTKGDDTFLQILPRRTYSTEEAHRALLALEQAPIVVYRPPPDALAQAAKNQDSPIEWLLSGALATGSICTIIDEGYQVGDSQALIGLLTRGRSRKCTTMVASQRPRWLTRFAFSEATRAFVFYLQDREDRLRIRELAPYPIDLDLAAYQFWGWRLGWREGIVASIDRPDFLDAPITKTFFI